MYYEGINNKGNRTAKRTYTTLFTSKNRIKNDFFDWVKEEHEEVVKESGETPTIVDLKIIGL